MVDLRINNGAIAFADPVIASSNGSVAGATFTASGTAAGIVAPVPYQWTSSGLDIAGAIGKTFTSSIALHAYSKISVRFPGRTPSSTPPEFFLVPAYRAASFTISLTDAFKVGQPVSFVPVGDFGQPHVRFVPTWRVDGAIVSNMLWYTPKAADAGKPWTLSVTGINLVGSHTPELLSGTVGAATGSNALTGTLDPTLALNLQAVNDYSDQCPFIDWAKVVRWILKDTIGSNPDLGHGAMNTAGYLDAGGWPLAMPAGYDQIEFLWATAAFNTYAKSLNPFLVTWEGAATFTGFDTTLSSVTSNSLTMTITGSGNVGLRALTLGTGATQFKNLKIIPQKWAALAAAGKQFNPEWMDNVLRGARFLRFMDWLETNSTGIVEFSEYKTKNYARYGGPIPLQVLVELCNENRSDLWFDFPTACSDDLVTDVATYVRDNLVAGLTGIFAYSNELWNVGIGTVGNNGPTKYDWFQARADVDFAASTNTNAYARNLNWIGRRISQIAQIVRGVYSGSSAKFHNTVGVATVTDQSNTAVMLNANIWLETYPGDYVAPHSVLDSIAGTNYVGTSICKNSTHLATIAAATPGTTANQVIRNLLFNPAVGSSIPHWRDAMRALRTYANSRGLKLLMYEGGFHMIQNFGVAFDADVHPAGPNLYAFDDSPEAQECIEAMFSVVKQFADGPYMQFSDVGQARKEGTWYIFDDPVTPLNRGRLLLSLAHTTPNWWNETVPAGRYQRVT